MHAVWLPTLAWMVSIPVRPWRHPRCQSLSNEYLLRYRYRFVGLVPEITSPTEINDAVMKWSFQKQYLHGLAGVMLAQGYKALSASSFVCIHACSMHFAITPPCVCSVLMHVNRFDRHGIDVFVHQWFPWMLCGLPQDTSIPPKCPDSFV